jgi:N-succinyldiaminopimelate aminotransferase
MTLVRTHGLVSRLRPFSSTIFAEMTALAVRTGAVNLGQGFPDTDGPAGMLEVARSAIASGQNQYPPGPGIPELRDAVAEQRAACYGLVHDPDAEVLVTVGATEAISAALLALVGQGDEVLLIEPYYDSYPAAARPGGACRWSPKGTGSRWISTRWPRPSRRPLGRWCSTARTTPPGRYCAVMSLRRWRRWRLSMICW